MRHPSTLGAEPTKRLDAACVARLTIAPTPERVLDAPRRLGRHRTLAGGAR
ncbi:hypothetical protein [Streptomyces sp. NRRL WC-3549]|uniref:hypothetical protein n=1 Tax=Streptomyces sp. NRRL WC-3549 TaxID=1463925 RepID=UPI000A7DE29B|nr:hypothetical protein [Streptomyces sp. NRRL WC-3549]